MGSYHEVCSDPHKLWVVEKEREMNPNERHSIENGAEFVSSSEKDISLTSVKFT